jgi:hypothetical protein
LGIAGKNCFYLNATPGPSLATKLMKNHIAFAVQNAVFEGLAFDI